MRTSALQVADILDKNVLTLGTLVYGSTAYGVNKLIRQVIKDLFVPPGFDTLVRIHGHAHKAHSFFQRTSSWFGFTIDTPDILTEMEDTIAGIRRDVNIMTVLANVVFWAVITWLITRHSRKVKQDRQRRALKKAMEH